MLAFSSSTPSALTEQIEDYKEAVKDAQPVGAFVNDQWANFTVGHCGEDNPAAQELGAQAIKAFLGRGYVNRCVNDIRRRPSQPLIQWRFHPHTVHRGRQFSINSGAFRRLKRPSATISIFQITAIARSTLL